MRRVRASPNVTRNKKLRDAQRSPKLSLKSTEIRVPVNLIFRALFVKYFLYICCFSHKLLAKYKTHSLQM